MVNLNIEFNTGSLLNDIREQKPIIHHMTNYVTVNDCANITLSIGASPIMADDIEEVQSIVGISSALVLNIGTLNRRIIAAMITAGKKANEQNIPVILDPVGVGASELRNETVRNMLEQIKFSVIRGNISEIRFIAGLHATANGVDASEVDSGNDVQTVIEVAKAAANKHGCMIAVTGATDIISNGESTICIENGHKMLSAITGTGCMCTSLIGSFCSITSDYFTAAISGILCMGIAGEVAFHQADHKGNGSYRIAVMDEISKLNAETIYREAKVYEA